MTTIAEQMIAHLKTISNNRCIPENTLFQYVSGTYQDQLDAIESLRGKIETQVRDGELWVRGLNAANTVSLMHNGAKVEVEAHLTGSGNMSFTFGGFRHIMKPDGEILQMNRTQGKPSWARSATLTKAVEN